MQVTIGLRASRTWHVWLQRVHGRMRSGSPARSLATRSGSAIWARVISTTSALGRVVVAAERPLGLADVDDRPLQHDRHVDAGADACRQLDVEAGRLVEVGPGLLDGEDRAPHDDEVVDALGDEGGGDADRRVGRDARPTGRARRTTAAARRRGRRRRPGARRRRRRGAKRSRSPPHSSPRWLVRPGEELAHEAVLTGVDLDAVAPGRHRRARRRRRTRRRRRRCRPPPSTSAPRVSPPRAPATAPTAAAGCRPTSPARRRGRATRGRARRGRGRPRRSRPTRAPAWLASGARSYGQSDSWTLAPSTTIVPHPPRARRS